RLFASASRGLAFSDDVGCSWRTPGGDLTGRFVGIIRFDLAGRVYLTTFSAGDGGMPVSILRSDNGGSSFDSTVYTGTTTVTSFVIAPSDPTTMYFSTRGPAPFQSEIFKSTDGGASFAPIDLTNAPASGAAYILAVDPRSRDWIAVRWLTPSTTDAGFATLDEALLIADTASGKWTQRVAVLDGALRAFLIAADGAWLVAAQQGRDVPMLFRSQDGGASFAPVANPPFIVDLAERGGIVYAATGFDDSGATFGLIEATSDDGGVTWQPGASFSRVQAISRCVTIACADTCLSLSTNVGLWDVQICSAAPPTGSGGSGGSGSGGDGRAGAGGHDAGAAGRAIASGFAGHVGNTGLQRRGCTCSVTGAGRGTVAVVAVVALAALAWRRRQRRSRQDAVERRRDD
ncbi:MAG TPA: MYXO-CTERM sorting domain-containing protein, partial [Polyangia bacterium]|nr:MYXO-CTERM sorting domain-containing protein [Polyangia bacterium]